MRVLAIGADQCADQAAGEVPRDHKVQRELDAATDYNGALTGFKSLPEATVMSVDDEGAHGVFPAHSCCVDGPIMTYLATGKMPSRQFWVSDE
jgi:hypothetical protein